MKAEDRSRITLATVTPDGPEEHYNSGSSPQLRNHTNHTPKVAKK